MMKSQTAMRRAAAGEAAPFCREFDMLLEAITDVFTAPNAYSERDLPSRPAYRLERAETVRRK